MNQLKVILLMTIMPVLQLNVAMAGSFGSVYENKISQSIHVIQSQKDDPSLLEKMIGIWSEKKSTCKTKSSSGDAWCSINECDVTPENCKKDHTLFFRGEDKTYEYPATSELWRTIRSGSSIADGLNIFELINKLDYLRQDMIQWNTKMDPQFINKLNYRQYLFSDHTEPIEMPFEDPVLNKTVYVDPLISFTINPRKAKGFARMEGEDRYAKVIVLSVPNEKIRSLCSDSFPEPGEIIESRDCSYALNEYSDETEVDAFIYLEPEYIWKVFTK